MMMLLCHSSEIAMVDAYDFAEGFTRIDYE